MKTLSAAFLILVFLLGCKKEQDLNPLVGMWRPAYTYDMYAGNQPINDPNHYMRFGMDGSFVIDSMIASRFYFMLKQYNHYKRIDQGEVQIVWLFPAQGTDSMMIQVYNNELLIPWRESGESFTKVR